MGVFNDNLTGKKPRLKLQYGTANGARRSVALFKKKCPKNLQYQTQVAHTMYYRAKYHKHQTKGMRNAMKIYRRFLQTLKRTFKKSPQKTRKHHKK
jgi:hypothetical protein